MLCTHVRRRLIHTLDGAILPEERAAIHAHIATCAECRRFAEALHIWPAHPSASERARHTPDLTERVLANVRPLPPPWVFREQQQRKQMPHLVAFMAGALGATLTFLMLCLTLIIGVAGTMPSRAGMQQHYLMVPEVWSGVEAWMNTLPQNVPHTIVTLVGTVAFAVLALFWFRTLAIRIGRDRF